jgi:hypothetical protein
MQLPCASVADGDGWSRWLDSHLRRLKWDNVDLVRAADGAFGTDAVSRWRTGKMTPKVPAIREVCRALGLPAVEGMIAAGLITADDVGATLVTPPPARASALTSDELLAEIGRRLSRADTALKRDARHIDEGPEADIQITPPTPLRPVPARTQSDSEQLGEDYAARTKRGDRPT